MPNLTPQSIGETHLDPHCPQLRGTEFQGSLWEMLLQEMFSVKSSDESKLLYFNEKHPCMSQTQPE